jgi:hypothetical protein
MGKSKNILVRINNIHTAHSEEHWAAQQWLKAEERQSVKGSQCGKSAWESEVSDQTPTKDDHTVKDNKPGYSFSSSHLHENIKPFNSIEHSL